MNQQELAALLGISPSLISRYKRQGMPVDDVRAAVLWMHRNVRFRFKTPMDSIAAKNREARKRAG